MIDKINTEGDRVDVHKDRFLAKMSNQAVVDTPRQPFGVFSPIGNEELGHVGFPFVGNKKDLIPNSSQSQLFS